MTLDPTRRFDAAAQTYSRARPAYPAEAIDWLIEAAGIAAGARILYLSPA
ncbi:MAG: hypothetical protein ACR2OC_10005 [Solirubrobacterales bacterium]